MKIRSAYLCVVVLLLTATAIFSTGIVLADWNVDDRLWANKCNGAEKDPVNIMFRGDGSMADALSEWDHHMPYWDDVQSDSTLYFKVHGTCTAREDKRMDPDWWYIRDHARFVDGDYDDAEEDWSAAAAHHDTCLPHIGVEFDDKRDKARTGFIMGATTQNSGLRFLRGPCGSYAGIMAGLRVGMEMWLGFPFPALPTKGREYDA